MITEAYQAKQNVYFDYDFEPLDLTESFPESLHKFPVGMLFRHVIEYSHATYYLYFEQELMGEEFDKLKQDWLRYCPQND